MSRRRILLVLGVVGALSVPAAGADERARASEQQTAQQTARDVPRADQATPSTGVLSGEVVRADGSGTALRYAYVVVLGVRTGAVEVTSTGADGRFIVRGLPPDDYLVGASKPPYVGALAGAKRPLGPGAALTLAAGQTITDIRIALAPGAVIAGTVTDVTGRPAAHIQVSLQSRRQNGPPAGVKSALTDAAGRYRFYGLVPGDYVVLGTAPSGQLPVRALSDAEVDAALKGAPPTSSSPVPEPAARYVPIYFPGTARPSEAQPITVGLGEDDEGIDFRLQAVTASKIQGTVVGADGTPPPRTLIRIVSTETGQAPMSMVQSGADGGFLFGAAVPGSYLLQATPIGQADRRTGSARVDVQDADVTGVQIVLAPPFTAEGRLTFAGTTPPPALAGWRVPVRGLGPGVPGLGIPLAVTNGSGMFTFTPAVPGPYVFGDTPLLASSADNTTWALDSVVADGRDVTDLPLELAADHHPAEIVVTLSDRWQALAGRLTVPSGASPADYSIVVFPADKTYWVAGSRRIVVARPSSDGHYTVGGPGPLSLPAGAYLMAATADAAHDPRADPAVLAALVSAALPVAVAPGAQKTQDLVIR